MDNISSFTVSPDIFTANQMGQINQPESDLAMIRLFHVSPDTPPVDVYVDGRLIVRNLSYGEISQVLKLSPGPHNIKVFFTCETKVALINSKVTLSPDGKYTIAVIGMLPNIGLRIIPEPKAPAAGGTANIRVVHLSPNAPAVDIILTDGALSFNNVRFKDISRFIPVLPGTFTVKVRVAGTTDVVRVIPNITLSAGVNYTIFIVGLVGNVPKLQALILTDSGGSFCT